MKRVISLASIIIFIVVSCNTNFSKKSNNFKDHKLYVVKIKDNYGYINYNGKFIINPQFDEAWDFNDGLARVVISDKYGFINHQGKFVINPQFDKAWDFSDSLALISVKVKVDNDSHYRYGYNNYGYGYNMYHTKYKYGYINKQGKILINPQFDKAWDFKNGLAKVKIGNRYGYIRTDGKFVFNPQ